MLTAGFLDTGPAAPGVAGPGELTTAGSDAERCVLSISRYALEAARERCGAVKRRGEDVLQAGHCISAGARPMSKETSKSEHSGQRYA